MSKHRSERGARPLAADAVDPLLAELESLWGLRARPSPHDRQGNGLLVCTSVLALIGCGCGTAAATLTDTTLLFPAAASAGASTVTAILHRRRRAFRVRPQPS